MNINKTQFVCCTECGRIIKKEDSCISVEGKLICEDCNKKILTNN